MDSKTPLNYNNYIEKFLKEMIFQGSSSASVMLYTKLGKLLAHKTSCEKWAQFYSESNAVKECHIKNAGVDLIKQNITDFTLIWDTLKPTNNESLFLNEQRIIYNHCHGVSICKPLPNDQILSIVLTGRNCDTNFANEVIKNKHILNKSILRILNVFNNENKIV